MLTLCYGRKQMMMDDDMCPVIIYKDEFIIVCLAIRRNCQEHILLFFNNLKCEFKL
jgi:hypothetical protein